uniref:Mutator-like transposase domain-containing protein n=1 Tax=Clastoptera arizonana TaxID=38151 RepID=A0A1B6C9D7_9HEMI
MKTTADEEARHTVELGDIDQNGMPLITVVADGCWCKRSYRSNYSSLSGVAAIVGYHTKKVLFMGLKNKYCTTCFRAAGQGVQPTAHTCYKNWGKNQSSSSMESAIIEEGFACSEEMYNLKYARLIANGDSSVYSFSYKTIQVHNCRKNGV